MGHITRGDDYHLSLQVLNRPGDFPADLLIGGRAVIRERNRHYPEVLLKILQEWYLYLNGVLILVRLVVLFQVPGGSQYLPGQFRINPDATQGCLPATPGHNAERLSHSGMIGAQNNKGIFEFDSGYSGGGDRPRVRIASMG